MWENSSKFLEKSLSFIRLTRDVILVLLFATSTAIASFVEVSSNNWCQVFWTSLTSMISDVKSMSLKIRCLQIFYRQLGNFFDLSESSRNLSLYHNRLTCNFVSVLNLRHHLIVHFSDDSVVFVHSRFKTTSEDVFHQWKNLFSVFLSTWFKRRRFSCIHCFIDKYRIFSIEQRRLVRTWQVLEQVCIVHLFGIQLRS